MPLRKLIRGAKLESKPETRAAAWLMPATLGNIVGGVLLVALLEYGQVKGGEE